MYHYSLMQWMLFFYVYCLFGWCFESTYVSVKQKKFVNRGFLNGPFLPIYGSGAIVVLFTALPFSGWPVLVYLVGALSATILEYVTGVCMEAVFKVRYWDYSYKKFNYKGHICLSSTIAWGFLSVGCVYGFHKPVERFVLLLPEGVLTWSTFVITMVLAVDCALSFRTAFELRDVLVKLEEAKEEWKRLQRRIEIIEAILADEGSRKLEQTREQVVEGIGQAREQVVEGIGQAREQVVEGIGQAKEQVVEGLEQTKEQVLEELGQAREQVVEGIGQAREQVVEGIGQAREQVVEGLEQTKEQVLGELGQTREQIMQEMGKLRERQAVVMDRLKGHLSMDKLRMLRRNPSAVSRKYRETFNEYRNRIQDFSVEDLKEKMKGKR